MKTKPDWAETLTDSKEFLIRQIISLLPVNIEDAAKTSPEQIVPLLLDGLRKFPGFLPELVAVCELKGRKVSSATLAELVDDMLTGKFTAPETGQMH